MAAHSPIGASGMYRWRRSACPGSVRLLASLPADHEERSYYAAEGTVAHEVAAALVMSSLALEAASLGPFQKGSVHKQDGFDIEITDEMLQSVSVYVNHVLDLARHKDARVMVEHSFHLKTIHEQAWGTADVVIWLPKSRQLIVGDYKHGAGTFVDVNDNPQPLYYALGALLENPQWKPKTIVPFICQPRYPCDDGPIRSTELSVSELLDFAGELLDSIEAIQDPDAPLRPGDWCKFCNAAAVCPARIEEAQQIARRDFETVPVESYDPKTLKWAMDVIPRVKQWIEAVHKFAYNEALRGHSPAGWKLVEKRANRKWDGNDADIANRLVQLGISDKDLYTAKLKTPPQIEKLLPKDKKEVLNLLTMQESSGLTLVPESDKRPAIAIEPEADFNEYLIGTDNGK